MLARPELHGTYGAVSSTHWLASAAGTSMFDRGGNAFDAAAAAAFVLQVVEPHLNGPGGDVPIMVFDAARDDVEVICGQGPMPAAATIDRFRSLGLDTVPGSGLLPACVPGVFGAWMRLVKEYGRLGVADVLEPAIGYAEHGFPLLPKAAAMIEVLVPLFRDHWTGSGQTYLRGGRAPAAGDRQRNPVLARTFRRIVAEATSVSGREAQADAAIAAFYTGFVAEAIDKFVADTDVLDATGRPNRGLLTGTDLASWRPTVERPVSLDYRGHQVYKPGPWSQGPVFLQQLALLSGFDLGSMGFGSADHLHTVVESAKLAFADREAWYGDPDHTDVPLAGLLDPQYTAGRRALIGAGASAELRPGHPDGRAPWFPPLPDQPSGPVEEGWRAQLRNGLPTVLKRTVVKGDTTTVTATDRDGNMVVATPSGGWLASSPVIPELGFPLGTRGQIAWLTEGHPNSLAPGKRPRTTLSPTIVRADDGRPKLAFGTPGGDRQDQWTLNFFLNHIDFGMSAQEAVEALTFHTDAVPTSFTPRQYRPRSVVVEDGVAPGTVAELRRRGHQVDLADPASLGQVCATGPDADGGVFAAASQRGQQAYGVVR
ncbi:gamma-glutamyltransferase family protein [Streptomyces sp. S465]|uniref:gamma-glutamyltransferase family protein n=1 Tax=Streptomyces sp. S465 TaxID=2979468 RepID=UPI0022A8B888|nr:gamma-glutamyltransferase family protein [Streptomyces sp. S465]WAP60921.1 gamma-glutamyltransferase family protein [Streptomyces sp. S465]